MNMAGAFAPLPPPYTASFPTLVLIFSVIGAMGAKEKDAFLLRSYAAANIFWRSCTSHRCASGWHRQGQRCSKTVQPQPQGKLSAFFAGVHRRDLLGLPCGLLQPSRLHLGPVQ